MLNHSFLHLIPPFYIQLQLIWCARSHMTTLNFNPSRPNNVQNNIHETTTWVAFPYVFVYDFNNEGSFSFHCVVITLHHIYRTILKRLDKEALWSFCCNYHWCTKYVLYYSTKAIVLYHYWCTLTEYNRGGKYSTKTTDDNKSISLPVPKYFPQPISICYLYKVMFSSSLSRFDNKSLHKSRMINYENLT